MIRRLIRLFLARQKDGDSINDYRNINRFSDKQIQLFIERITLKQQWLAKKGIQYLFVIAPSKQYIYPEHLPEYIKPIKRQNLVKQLTQELSKYPGKNFIDLTPVLKQAKKDKLLYFKADSHWNYFGTNIAQFAIAKNLAKMFSGKIRPILYSDDIFQKQEFQGGLSRYMGLGNYFKEVNFVPKLDDCARNYTPKNRVFKQVFSTQCKQGSLSALVFRDSFFTSLQPFMSLYFKNSSYIWEKMTFITAEKQLSDFPVDVVIEELVDRYYPKSLSPSYQY